MEQDFFQAGNHYVRYDASVPCVIVESNSYTSGEDFRLALINALECFKEKSADHPKLGWLADTGNAEVFPEEDIAWVNNEMNPQMHKAGLRHFAFVLPKDMFAAMGVEEYSENTDPNSFNIQNFDDKEKAKEWLRTVLA